MPISDPARVLLVHNRWATRALLETCESLSRAQFHQRFEMGPGSLHDTCTHILGAMRGWGHLLAGREQGERLEATERTPSELRALLEELADDLDASAAAHPHDEILSGSRGGRSYTFTRGGVITHVTTHGMHHRAQCLNMLRQLGVEPLPHSAVLEWMIMTDSE